MDTPLTAIQAAAQRRPMPRSIEQGAFSSPDWTDVGELPRSAAQVGQDITARNLLDVEHERNMASIDRAAARNDPMRRQIEAARQNREYEREQPYGSVPRVRAKVGDAEYVDDSMEQPLGRPSIGEMRAIQHQLAVRGPRDEQTYRLMGVRSREARAMEALRRRLDSDVASGLRNQQDADEEMKRAMRVSAFKLHALGGLGMGGLFHEDDDDFLNSGAQVAPEPRPSRVPQVPAPESVPLPPPMDEYDYFDR